MMENSNKPSNTTVPPCVYPLWRFPQICCNPFPLLLQTLQPAFTLSASVSYDVRTQAMNLIKSLPLEYLVANVYPHLYALQTLSEKVGTV